LIHDGFVGAGRTDHVATDEFFEARRSVGHSGPAHKLLQHVPIRPGVNRKKYVWLDIGHAGNPGNLGNAGIIEYACRVLVGPSARSASLSIAFASRTAVET